LWPCGCVTALLAGVALLFFAPSALNWWQHRRLSSAASEVELGAGCERTAAEHEGEAIGIFASPPSLTVTYMCWGMPTAATRDAADAALRAGGFDVASPWRGEDYINTGPVEVSSWTGHGARVIADADDGRVELMFDLRG
jgi:hypothetical protein